MELVAVLVGGGQRGAVEEGVVEEPEVKGLVLGAARLLGVMGGGWVVD